MGMATYNYPDPDLMLTDIRGRPPVVDELQERIRQMGMTAQYREAELHKARKEVWQLQQAFDNYVVRVGAEMSELRGELDLFRKKDQRKRVVRRRHESHTN